MSAEGLPLTESTAIVGRAAWVEQRMFELEERWSDDGADAELAVHLATNSRYHGWHGELLADCLPDSPSLHAADHVVAPSAGWASLFESDLDSSPDWPDAGWARVVAIGRVLLPRTVAGHDALAARLSPVADGPLLRALGHIVDDQVAEWRATERLVQARLDGPAGIEQAAALAARLERLIAGGE